jgi:DNA-binding NarL/FixJ family response regulator
MKEPVIRILIVDDHQIVIDGLQSLLEDAKNLHIVATTTEPLKVPGLIAAHHADVLLTDVMMPGLTGQQLAKQVRKSFPNIKILALSMSGEASIVNSMINDSDINGYALKNIGKQQLLDAIYKIAGGGIYFSDEVLSELAKFSNIKKENEDCQLTIRETEIIRLIEKELSNKEIADTLFISERTVETHRKNIFRKTKTFSVIGLIKYAYEHRLI